MKTIAVLVAVVTTSACALLAPPKMLAFEYTGKADMFTLEEESGERAVQIQPMCTPVSEASEKNPLPVWTCTVPIPDGWGGRRAFIRSYAGGTWSEPGKSITLPRVR